MLPNLTNTADNLPQNDDENKCSKPSLFHDMYCNTGINPKGMTRIASKPDPSTNKQNFNQEALRKGQFTTVFPRWSKIMLLGSK